MSKKHVLEEVLRVLRSIAALQQHMRVCRMSQHIISRDSERRSAGSILHKYELNITCSINQQVSMHNYWKVHKIFCSNRYHFSTQIADRVKVLERQKLDKFMHKVLIGNQCKKERLVNPSLRLFASTFIKMKVDFQLTGIFVFFRFRYLWRPPHAAPPPQIAVNPQSRIL